MDPLGHRVPLPARLAVGVLVLAWLAWSDWRRHGDRATRWREYGFLLSCALLAIFFAEVHDALTLLISPKYFIAGKGLTRDGLEWQVAKLAMSASYWMGLLLGLLYLIASNPWREGPRLSYGVLFQLALLPIAGAMVFSLPTGLWFRATVHDVSPSFALVWGIHTGSYLGAAAGGIAGLASILFIRQRNKR